MSSTIPAATFTLPLAATVAIALALLGGTIALAGIIAFRRHGTTVNPMQPQETTSFVRTGIYRITRNPMYLGLAATLVAWAVYLGNTAALLLLVAFVAYMTEFQIKPEERALLMKFGPEYADYKSMVRRWL